MTTSHDDGDWLELLGMMTAQFDGLLERVLENLETLLNVARRMVHCAEAALLVPDGDGSQLRFLVSVNSRPGLSEIVKTIGVPTDRSIAGCVFRTGQSIAVANPEDFYPGVDQKTGLTTSVYLATPVTDQGDVLGVATFVNRLGDEPQEPFTEAEIAASTRVAALAAAGLRYYSRMSLQQQLLRTDLDRVRHRFGDGAEESPGWDGASEGLSGSPMARAIFAMERLSQRNQDLAAELLTVLNQHAQGAE